MFAVTAIMKHQTFSRCALFSLSLFIAGCNSAPNNGKAWEQTGTARPYFRSEAEMLPRNHNAKNAVARQSNDSSNKNVVTEQRRSTR